ncbi:MAG: hypothetical protein Q8M65_02045 [Rhodoglobus sp.]|nr:hypothetical protein [Rhodoglobus sp.]
MTTPKIQKLLDLTRTELDEEIAEVIDAMQPCVPVRGDFATRVLAGLAKHVDSLVAVRANETVMFSNQGVAIPTTAPFTHELGPIDDSGRSTCHGMESAGDPTTSVIDSLPPESTTSCARRPC